jgi:hypothetical protein
LPSGDQAGWTGNPTPGFIWATDVALLEGFKVKYGFACSCPQSTHEPSGEMASKPEPAGPLVESVPSTKSEVPVAVSKLPQGLADPLNAATTVLPLRDTEWHATHVMAGVTFVGI